MIFFKKEEMTYLNLWGVFFCIGHSDDGQVGGIGCGPI